MESNRSLDMEEQSPKNSAEMEDLLVSSDSEDDNESQHAQQERNNAVNQADTNRNFCEPYFNSTMGGRDLRVLFAMSEGIPTNVATLPKHKDPPFCISKKYHREVKPDLGTLQQEVVRRYNAYGLSSNGKPLRPKNWNKDKCLAFLNEHPIPALAHFSEIEFLQKELQKWSEIQKTVNDSQQQEEDRVLQKSWNSDVPYLRMYHVLIDDKLRLELTKAFTVKSREELDGRNSGIYKSYYEQAAEKFNDSEWIPSSLSLPDLHDDFAESKMLILNVMPITAEVFQRKLEDARYKMVKVIADWEKSGSGRGQVVETDSDYEFIDGDDRKAFLRERPPHVLYLWHVAKTYGILNTVRQLCS